MSYRIAIELSDTGIIVTDGVRLLCDSPGYWVRHERKDYWGDEARARFIRQPGAGQNRFWSALAQSDDHAVEGECVQQVLQHLQYLCLQLDPKPDDVILSVPATFTRQGLGRLLGICNEINLPVRCMVHQAVLSPRQPDCAVHTVHIDVQLHQTAVTVLQLQAKEYQVESVIVLDQLGMENFYARLLSLFADAFVRTTRFDPTQRVETEQQLFDQLPVLLQSDHKGESVSCSIEYQGKQYQASLDTERLRATGQQFVQPILDCIAERFSQLPMVACISEQIASQLGFIDIAGRAGIGVQTLAKGHHASQVLRHADQLIGEDTQIYLIKKLPGQLADMPLKVEPAAAAQDLDTPTHLLYRHSAFDMSQPLFVIQTASDELQFARNKPNTKDHRLLLMVQNQRVRTYDLPDICCNGRSMPEEFAVRSGDHITSTALPDELVLIQVK